MISIKSMTLPLKTILFNKKFVLVVFVVLHILLFNINVAEWGDSYRMLRASNFIRKGAYPNDEKRPPLFPAILALRPSNVDPVIWGRGVVFVISLGYFLVYYSFAEKFIKNRKYLLAANLLFIFNPVILYWSIRIMSDILFGFLVLLSLFWLYLWGEKADLGKLILLGFISGLTILTRFEGYLLFISVAVGLFLAGERLELQTFKLKNLANLFKKNFWRVGVFVVTAVLIVLPYILANNPFGSSYFGEPSGRSYDLNTLWIYLVSLVFLFGFIPAVNVIGIKPKPFKKFFMENPALCVFTVLELILILLWPAAIPRLFAAVIPILIIPLTLSLKDCPEEMVHKKKIPVYLGAFTVFTFFVVSQYFLKLQFLVPQKWWFVVLVLTQLSAIVSLYLKKIHFSGLFLLMGLMLWGMSPIFLHKDTFISVKNAAEYVANNLQGVVVYNDVSSVSDWYLNNKNTSDNVVGFYYNLESKKNLSFDALTTTKADYLLLTNEHNTSMTVDIGKRPYLEEIRDFRYNINGKEFFAKVVKVNKDYIE